MLVKLIMSRVVHLLHHRKLDYRKGLCLQRNISCAFRNTENNEKLVRNMLIITEHDPVYTIGIRTENYVADEIRLKKLGAQFFKTNRGGLITFHGPGQLIAYPILNLKQFSPSLRWYINRLEKLIVSVCEAYTIDANVFKDVGVWVNDKKICSIGVHCSRYITTHGLALNCNIDLTWFSHIVPCGLKDKGVTSLSKELQTNVSVEEVVPIFKHCFKNCFDCEVVDLDENEKRELLASVSNGNHIN